MEADWCKQELETKWLHLLDDYLIIPIYCRLMASLTKGIHMYSGQLWSFPLVVSRHNFKFMQTRRRLYECLEKFMAYDYSLYWEKYESTYFLLEQYINEINQILKQKCFSTITHYIHDLINFNVTLKFLSSVGEAT